MCDPFSCRNKVNLVLNAKKNQTKALFTVDAQFGDRLKICNPRIGDWFENHSYITLLLT